MGEFSLAHILILLVVVLIFFGPSRLPGLGQSIGKAIKGFKQGLSEVDSEIKDVQNSAREQLRQPGQESSGVEQKDHSETKKS